MSDKNRKLESVSQGIMTVAEAADFLSLSKESIYELMDSGQIDFADMSAKGKIRRSRRPTRKSVIDFAASRVVIGGEV